MIVASPVHRIYRKIQRSESAYCVEFFADSERSGSFASLNHYIGEIEHLVNVSKANFASLIFENALIDLQKSMNSAAHGRRAEAHASLRMALEKTASFIWFSSTEFEFILWKMHRKDTSWSFLIDSNNGIFSKDFFDCYSPELSEYRSQFQSIMLSVYRECSEYIHGNYRSIVFSGDESEFDWYKNCDVAP